MFTLVAGTGYTGLRVLERLPVDAVAGVSRSPVTTDRAFQLVDFDALDTSAFELPARYAVLYTCPPGDQDDTRLRRFLAHLAPTPGRFVYISTTGVYGNCDGAVVNENTPLNPGSAMSRPRVAAEKLLSAWADPLGCDLVILRVPGIYGPGRLGIERIEQGGAFIAGDEANPGNRIHVDDLATCCIAALSEQTPAGIYNVGDGDHRTGTWFADEVARQAELPEPRKISRAQAEKEFSAARLAFLASSRIVDTTKMREVLGITPRTPEEGIKDSL
ncbi:MAG: NAD-dependent epimerase/dehydratase family protein [Gammaproteobacteria bacterium]|nr:NAD-dependent epimerase/dehydratase family protein [Gammaproteobacteria bacterium]